MSAVDAMKPDAPVLHENLTRVSGRALLDQIGSNTLSITFESGEIEDGFRQADVVVEGRFNAASVHQGYIEPHSCTADSAPDGSITIWTTCQAPYHYREQISQVLGVPQALIKVIPTEVGGAFGGKEVAYLEPLAALLSRRTGHPVKITLTRAEEFEATGPASGGFFNLRLGATKDGKLVAADLEFAYEAGAFPGSPVVGGATVGLGRYNIPHQRVRGYDVVVNRPKTSHYRAPGATPIHFASEQLIDELCRALGMDPIEFRRQNIVNEGDRNIQGIPYPRLGGAEVLEAMRASDHYQTPLEGANRGRGVALGFWKGGGGISWCTLSVNPDGSISLASGSPDMSGTRTTIAMQAAETLGIPMEYIRPEVASSDSGGFSMGSWGSRTTFATGLAAVEAARDLNRKMIERAAKIWGATTEDIESAEGSYVLLSDPSKRFSFKELAERLPSTGGALVGSAVVEPPAGVGAAFVGNIVDVEVDPETGKVEILRFTVIQDAGQAVHHDMVEGQMQGGSVQGIGWALSEGYVYNDQGIMNNPTFLDYRLQTALDVPAIESVIVEVFNPAHPYGVRGAGEVNITTPPAAIANAIFDAMGVRIRDLPMTPADVLVALGS